MSDPVLFVKTIAERFRGIGSLLEEHVTDNMGEILPHAFFGDLTRYILTFVAAGTAGGGLEPKRELREALEKHGDRPGGAFPQGQRPRLSEPCMARSSRRHSYDAGQKTFPQVWRALIS